MTHLVIELRDIQNYYFFNYFNKHITFVKISILVLYFYDYDIN